MSTEAESIAEIARESERFAQTAEPDTGLVHVSITRDGERVVSTSYEQFSSEPHRYRGTTTVTEVESFTTLLAMDSHRRAVIFADEDRANLTAVINYDGGWRDHRLVLQLRKSEQFQAWAKRSGEFYSQTVFAEFIEDAAADILEPSAADMLELAQTFHATKAVQFESSTRLQSGAVAFRFHEQIDAKAGTAGQFEIPETFRLGLPIWRGGPRIEMFAKLRYRIDRSALLLGFKLVSLDDTVRASFAKAAEDVKAALNADHGHTVVFGPAPTEIAPLP